MVIRRNKMKRKRRDECTSPLLDESPKRTKVHAQRKFAQGSNVNSPVITPVKELDKPDRSKLDMLPDPVELLPIKRPNTEDFLTFLCFRGTPLLPPSLNFFNTASIVDNNGQVHEIKSESPKNGPIDTSVITKSGTGSADRPFIAFGVRKRADPIVISKQMDKKRRHALALQALRRKYQEQKMAKIRAVTISKLSEKVSNRTLVRTNSVTKSEKTETIARKSTIQKNKVKVIATKHIKVTAQTVKTLRPKVKPKMCLRSFRGRFIQQELPFRAVKKHPLPEKKILKKIEKKRIEVKKKEGKCPSTSEIKKEKLSILEKDIKSTAAKPVKKLASDKKSQDIPLRVTRSNKTPSKIPIRVKPKRHMIKRRILITNASTLIKPRVLRSQTNKGNISVRGRISKRCLDKNGPSVVIEKLPGKMCRKEISRVLENMKKDIPEIRKKCAIIKKTINKPLDQTEKEPEVLKRPLSQPAKKEENKSLDVPRLEVKTEIDKAPLEVNEKVTVNLEKLTRKPIKRQSANIVDNFSETKNEKLKQELNVESGSKKETTKPSDQLTSKNQITKKEEKVKLSTIKKESNNRKQSLEKSKQQTSKVQKEVAEAKSSQRPSRKSKEAAAIYMEILSHKLVNEGKVDDDTVSIDSFPELPNVKKTEQRENELKAKANHKNKQEEKCQKVDKSVENSLIESESQYFQINIEDGIVFDNKKLEEQKIIEQIRIAKCKEELGVIQIVLGDKVNLEKLNEVINIEIDLPKELKCDTEVESQTKLNKNKDFIVANVETKPSLPNITTANSDNGKDAPEKTINKSNSKHDLRINKNCAEKVPDIQSDICIEKKEAKLGELGVNCTDILVKVDYKNKDKITSKRSVPLKMVHSDTKILKQSNIDKEEPLIKTKDCSKFKNNSEAEIQNNVVDDPLVKVQECSKLEKKSLSEEKLSPCGSADHEPLLKRKDCSNLAKNFIIKRTYLSKQSNMDDEPLLMRMDCAKLEKSVNEKLSFSKHSKLSDDEPLLKRKDCSKLDRKSGKLSLGKPNNLDNNEPVVMKKDCSKLERSVGEKVSVSKQMNVDTDQPLVQRKDCLKVERTPICQILGVSKQANVIPVKKKDSCKVERNLVCEKVNTSKQSTEKVRISNKFNIDDDEPLVKRKNCSKLEQNPVSDNVCVSKETNSSDELLVKQQKFVIEQFNVTDQSSIHEDEPLTKEKNCSKLEKKFLGGKVINDNQSNTNHEQLLKGKDYSKRERKYVLEKVNISNQSNINDAKLSVKEKDTNLEQKFFSLKANIDNQSNINVEEEPLIKGKRCSTLERKSVCAKYNGNVEVSSIISTDIGMLEQQFENIKTDDQSCKKANIEQETIIDNLGYNYSNKLKEKCLKVDVMIPKSSEELDEGNTLNLNILIEKKSCEEKLKRQSVEVSPSNTEDQNAPSGNIMKQGKRKSSSKTDSPPIGLEVCEAKILKVQNEEKINMDHTRRPTRHNSQLHKHIESDDSDESFHMYVKIPRKKQVTRSKGPKVLLKNTQVPSKIIEKEYKKSNKELGSSDGHNTSEESTFTKECPKVNSTKIKRFTKTKNLPKCDNSFSESDEEPLSKLTINKSLDEAKQTAILKEDLLRLQKSIIESPNHRIKSNKKTSKHKEIKEKTDDKCNEKAVSSKDEMLSCKPKRECAKRPQNYLPMFSSSDEENFFHGFSIKPEKKSSAKDDSLLRESPPLDLLSKDIGRRFGKGKVNMSNEQIEKWLKDSAMAGNGVKKEEELIKFCEELPTETSFDTQKLKTPLLVLDQTSKQESTCDSKDSSSHEKERIKSGIFSKSPSDRKLIFRKDKPNVTPSVSAFSVNNESSIYAFGEDTEEVLSTPFRRPTRRPSSTTTSKSEDESTKTEEPPKICHFRIPLVVKQETIKAKEDREECPLSPTAISQIEDNLENISLKLLSSSLSCTSISGTNQKIPLVPTKKFEDKCCSPMVPPSNVLTKGTAKRNLERNYEFMEDIKYKVPSSPSASSSSSAKLYKRQNVKTKTRSVEVCNPIKLTDFPLTGSTELVEAPTFYPTEKEFQDPIEYIGKIGMKAEQFGICRIVPPSNFKPECKVTDDMRFTAYNQYVNKMLHRWGPNFKELMAIKKYLHTQNINLTQAPWIGGMEIDLPRLYQTVQSLGGLKEVIEKKKWPKVSEAMRIPKSAQDRVTKLDDIYCKYLLPYDTLSPAEREKLFDEVETEWAKRESKALQKLQECQNEDNNPETDSESENEAEECIVKGRNMALNAFYRIARNTMSMWFKNSDPTTQEIEQEFWKHVTTKQNHICVHSGSIDSGNWGYGFAVSKNSPFARHAWNLKVLTNNSGSVLRSLGPVMGVTVPTLHVGMVFSACCWYRDPHSLPWIEYLHTGGSKIWYGIPDSASATFHSAITKLVPNYCRNQAIWLPSDTVMIPPSLLIESGVSLCRTVQEPGHFIVVFPKAFTSSISTGYVVSESVFFAPPSWLKTAQNIFNELRHSCEPSMFSLDRLILSIINDTRTNVDILRQIIPSVQELTQKEKVNREKVRSLGVTEFEVLPLPEAPNARKRKKLHGEDGEYECEICRMNLFISMILDSQEDVMYCIEHAVEQLEKSGIVPKNCKLLFTYSDDHLDGLVDKINAAIDYKLQKKIPNKFSGMPTLLTK